MQYYKTYASKARSMKAKAICCHRLEGNEHCVLFNKGKTENKKYRMARIVIRNPVYRNKPPSRKSMVKYFTLVTSYLI